jgi:hypothetical protein
LAHAASFRQTFYFARWKFRGFLHSFKFHRHDSALIRRLLRY